MIPIYDYPISGCHDFDGKERRIEPLLPSHGRVERRRESVMRPPPTLQPELLPEQHCSDKITDYDYRLLIVYLRLLDAAADGADWADVQSYVFPLDPADKPRGRRAA